MPTAHVSHLPASEAPPGPDLARLNASERQVLELLAQGHTAKSIAHLTGQSESAIHERLRSARRKTGVGSSRELARLLGALGGAQENRPEIIGLAAAPAPASFDGPQSPPRRVWLRQGPLVMFVIASAAVAALLLLQATSATAPDARAPVDDPLIGSDIYVEPVNLHKLHDEVRSEPRDPAWAPQAEAKLRAAFDRADRGAKVELRVICASTLCEVAGTLDGGRAEMSAAEQAQQSKKLREEVAPGLTENGLAYADARKIGKNSVFVFYWKRVRT